MGSADNINKNKNEYCGGENSTQKCCTDSNFVSRGKNRAKSSPQEKEREEKDESLGSMWENSSANGGDYSVHDFGNSVEDSLDTAWTDEKHSSYLNSIEASFVKQMYEKKCRVLDLYGRTCKQSDSSDPDFAESRPNLRSTNKSKALQKGCCQISNNNRAQHLGASTSQALLASPWIQHFRPPPYLKAHQVLPRTVHESFGENEISAVGGPHINALGLEHSDTKTAHEELIDSNQEIFVWHHRLGYNFGVSNSLCGKTEIRNVCTEKSLVHPITGPDKGEQDLMRETNVIRIHNSRIIKKQKLKIESVRFSENDQVVPLLQRLNSADIGDSASKLNHKESASATWNSNNLPVSLDNKGLIENGGCSNRKNWQENTALSIRQESAMFHVIKKSS